MFALASVFMHPYNNARNQAVDGITGIGVNITATALAHKSGHMFVARVPFHRICKSCVIG